MDQLLPAPGKVSTVTHHPAIPYREIGAFMKLLRQRDGIGAAALEFAILTAARSGEVLGATWAEIDTDARVWTIPPSRMKAGREHRVPLSGAALELLKRMESGRLDDYIFPGAKDGKPLSDMSLTAVLRRMERNDFVPHGCRSTFRDWCAECTRYPREMAEIALAHAVGDETERAYQRGDMIEKRRRMMQDWAAWCAKPIQPGVVVPLGRKSTHGGR
jgi:integrase